MATRIITEFHPPANPVHIGFHKKWENGKRIPLTQEEQARFLYDAWMAVGENIRYFDSKLLGEIYTLLEIAIPDDRQRQALKTQIKNATFRWQEESFEAIADNFDSVAGTYGFGQCNGCVMSHYFDDDADVLDRE